MSRVKDAARTTLVDRVQDYIRSSLSEGNCTKVDRVQDYIRSSLSEGNCTIERCDEKMDVSVRTLQAKLSESQLSFSYILEEQRIALAQSYLKQYQVSLDDVAANLGYSEQSSFGRAFKRWTGMTPKQFRQQAVAN